MAEIHYFDIHIAKLYGVNCAVVLQNIWHWIKKNEANDQNFYDGHYWTYNSTKAFKELFPYLSQKQIETALKKLRDEEILITGNYNEHKYDRTLWYAITDKGKSILLTGEMETTNKGNGNPCEVKPIPNVTANVTAVVNPNYTAEFETLWKLYPNKKGKESALKAYIKARKGGVSCEVVKQGVIDYAKECKLKKREKKYIKHGSTWFNNQCWEDEYDITTDNNPKNDGWCFEPEEDSLDDLF